MKFKHWLIKKCGGYTKEEYENLKQETSKKEQTSKEKETSTTMNTKVFYTSMPWEPMIYNLSVMLPREVSKETAIEYVKKTFSEDIANHFVDIINLETQLDFKTGNINYHTKIGIVPPDKIKNLI